MDTTDWHIESKKQKHSLMKMSFWLSSIFYFWGVGEHISARKRENHSFEIARGSMESQPEFSSNMKVILFPKSSATWVLVEVSTSKACLPFRTKRSVLTMHCSPAQGNKCRSGVCAGDSDTHKHSKNNAEIGRVQTVHPLPIRITMPQTDPSIWLEIRLLCLAT